MSLTYIRHDLQTRTRTFFYKGVVFLSVFKTYQNKQVCHIKFRKNKQRKWISVQISKKFSEGRHFTVEKFHIIQLNGVRELYKNFKNTS